MLFKPPSKIIDFDPLFGPPKNGGFQILRFWKMAIFSMRGLGKNFGSNGKMPFSLVGGHGFFQFWPLFLTLLQFLVGPRSFFDPPFLGPFFGPPKMGQKWPLFGPLFLAIFCLFLVIFHYFYLFFTFFVIFSIFSLKMHFFCYFCLKIAIFSLFSTFSKIRLQKSACF